MKKEKRKLERRQFGSSLFMIILGSLLGAILASLLEPYFMRVAPLAPPCAQAAAITAAPGTTNHLFGGDFFTVSLSGPLGKLAAWLPYIIGGGIIIDAISRFLDMFDELS